MTSYAMISSTTNEPHQRGAQESEENNMNEIIKALEAKGYMVCNQFNGFFGTFPDTYELYDRNGNIVADNLTEQDLIKTCTTL